MISHGRTAGHNCLQRLLQWQCHHPRGIHTHHFSDQGRRHILCTSTAHMQSGAASVGAQSNIYLVSVPLTVPPSFRAVNSSTVEVSRQPHSVITVEMGQHIM